MSLGCDQTSDQPPQRQPFRAICFVEQGHEGSGGGLVLCSTVAMGEQAGDMRRSEARGVVVLIADAKQGADAFGAMDFSGDDAPRNALSLPISPLMNLKSSPRFIKCLALVMSPNCSWYVSSVATISIYYKLFYKFCS